MAVANLLQASHKAFSLTKIGPPLFEEFFKLSDLAFESRRSALGMENCLGDVLPERLDQAEPVSSDRPMTALHVLRGARITIDLPGQLFGRDGGEETRQALLQKLRIALHEMCRPVAHVSPRAMEAAGRETRRGWRLISKAWQSRSAWRLTRNCRWMNGAPRLGRPRRHGCSGRPWVFGGRPVRSAPLRLSAALERGSRDDGIWWPDAGGWPDARLSPVWPLWSGTGELVEPPDTATPPPARAGQRGRREGA